MKKCTHCETEKPLSEFVRSTTTKSGLQAICKICRNEQRREYCKANPATISRIVRRRLLKKYGLTEESFDAILERQDRKCAICISSDPKNAFGVFVIDHDHRTNKVRGLLCTHCNATLGMIEKSGNCLANIPAYLENNLSTSARQLEFSFPVENIV